MLENLIFSLNSTIPIFLIIAVGFGLGKLNMFNDGFLKACNKFNFKVTLPVLLFEDLSGTNFKDTFDLKFFLFCAIVTSISFFGAWGIAKLVFRKRREDIGEFVQACYRSSAAVLGIALIQNIYGSTNMAGMMMLGAVPLYNIYAVLVLQFESPEMQKDSKQIKKALLNICKNPIIIAILLGLISSLIGIDYPKIIDTGLNYIGRMATPLALVCIGAGFKFKSAAAKIKPSIFAALTKILFLPLIFLPVAILMGFSGEKLIAIFVMLAAPTTPSTFIMAQQFGHEGTISSSAVIITTLGASITLTFFVFGLRSLGYI